MGHKGVIDCCMCDNDAFFEGQCGNDIIKDTGYHSLDNGLWLCPECMTEAADINLKEAFDMVFELAQGNMIEPISIRKDADLFLQHHTQEKAMYMAKTKMGRLFKALIIDPTEKLKE